MGRKTSKNMTTLKTCLFLERERDLRPRGAVLGRSWDLCWRSWAAPGAYVAGLGPLLGLCGRSWAALGPYVRGLGPLLGPMFAILGPLLAVLGPLLAVLGRLGRSGAFCGRSWGGIRPQSGPNPSGKAIRQGKRQVQNSQAPEARYGFFCRYLYAYMYIC